MSREQQEKAHRRLERCLVVATALPLVIFAGGVLFAYHLLEVIWGKGFVVPFAFGSAAASCVPLLILFRINEPQ